MDVPAPKIQLQRFNQLTDELLASCMTAADEMVAQQKQLQVYFQTYILPLSADDDGKSRSPQWVSALTELNRHMRLLGIDIRFWQAAQQPETAQQKRIQIQNRLQQVQGFGQALQGLTE